MMDFLGFILDGVALSSLNRRERRTLFGCLPALVVGVFVVCLSALLLTGYMVWRIWFS